MFFEHRFAPYFASQFPHSCDAKTSRYRVVIGATTEPARKAKAQKTVVESATLTPAQEMTALDALKIGVLSVKVIAEALHVPLRTTFALGMRMSA